MSKVIFNCRSIFSKTNYIKCKFENNFLKNDFVCKIQNNGYKENSFYNNKICNFIKIKHNTKISSSYNKTNFKTKIKNNILEKYCIKYNIKNVEITKRIEEFYFLTKIYIDLYVKKNNIFINNNINVVFNVLKFHEEKIKDYNYYSSIDLEKIFVKELIYEIEDK